MNNRASSIAFIDFLTCMLLLYFYMFAITLVQVTPKQTSARATEMKAEMVIELTWPDASIDDVDLWVLLPDGRKVWYLDKDLGVATLDRDDRGGYGDTFYRDGHFEVIQSNKEVVAIRGILPGRYVVNAHYYRNYTVAEIDHTAPGPVKNLPEFKGVLKVKGVLTDLNPKVQEIVSVEKVLLEQGSQVTLFAFEVDAEGNVSHVNRELSLPFAHDDGVK